MAKLAGLFLLLAMAFPLAAQFTPAVGYCSQAHCDSTMSDHAGLTPPGFVAATLIASTGGAGAGLGCSTNGTYVACTAQAVPGLSVFNASGAKICDSGTVLDASSFKSAPAIDSAGKIVTADGTHVAMFDSAVVSGGHCQTVWESSALDGPPISPVFDPANNLVLVATQAGGVYSIYGTGGSAGTVKNHVTMSTGGHTYITANTPCVSGGKMFVVSQYATVNERLFGYNTVDLTDATGWVSNPAPPILTGGANSSPLCAQGQVMFDSADSGGSFVSINQSDGNLTYALVTLTAQPLASFALDLRTGTPSAWLYMGSVAQLRRIKISDGTTLQNITTKDNNGVSGYPVSAVTVSGTAAQPYITVGLNPPGTNIKEVVQYDLLTTFPNWTLVIDSAANGQFPIIPTGGGNRAVFFASKTGGVYRAATPVAQGSGASAPVTPANWTRTTGTSPQMISGCGVRPDMTTLPAANVCIFDTHNAINCSAVTKPDYPSQKLFGMMYTNCGTPTNTADAGVAKADVFDGTVRGNVVDVDTDCGNPALLTNGGVLFQCQKQTDLCGGVACSSVDADPGVGQTYDLYGCKGLPCTSTNMGLLYSQTSVRAFCVANPASCETSSGYNWTTMTTQGGLDPHFLPWDESIIYWSVQEFSYATPAWCTDPTNCSATQWAIHFMQIDWSGAKPALQQVLGRWTPGNYAAYTTGVDNVSHATECSQYYKASSAVLNSDNSVTVYTQAAQATHAGSNNLQPWLDPNGDYIATGCFGQNCNSPCHALGASLRQSGLFSFRVVLSLGANNSPHGGSWAQIAPLWWQTPTITNGEYNPYYEFPLLIPGTSKMLAISNAYSGNFGSQQSEREANLHDDYYQLDTSLYTLTAISRADVVGNAWNTALANGGTFLGMAHAGYNPTARFMITRTTNSNTPGWVVKIPLDYAQNPNLLRFQFTPKIVFHGKILVP